MNLEAMEHIYREEWASVVATLARQFGDLQLAEDATQEAFAKAAVLWPRDGIPDTPRAWLTVTAWHKILDHLRRERLFAERMQTLAFLNDSGGNLPAQEEMLGMEDDRLALLFTCCHPALAVEVRIALTLRYVAGLTTHEIARAFLVPEPTLAQRFVRAKRKIRQAGIRFTVPASNALLPRLMGVQRVIYLVFNEGYAATTANALIRNDLCAEAIWLGRMLHHLLPEDPETTGLLALMLLHHARAPGRQTLAGQPIPLAEQDRSCWQQDVIAEGVGLLDDAMRWRSPGPYQLQAAIAALHAQAQSFDQTDWSQIVMLYGELARQAPSAVVEINRAVAVGMADGPHAGLAILRPLLLAGTLDDYGPLHAAHADLLDRAGDPDAATVAWERAIVTTENPMLRAALHQRMTARAASLVPENDHDSR